MKKLRDIGFSVIPLGTITLDEKGHKKVVYTESWKAYQSRLATDAEIDSWNAVNVGVVSGRVSNILVLDCDDYKETYDKELFKSLNIPVTPCQKTARGGKQYFFRFPHGVEIRNSVSVGHNGSGIDIRAEGGMCVIAPSKASYGAYEWIIDPFTTELADAPQKLIDILVASTYKKGSTAHKYVPTKDLMKLREGEGRNSAMTQFLGKILKTVPMQKWEEEIYPAAQILNSTFNPPMEEDEFNKTYDSIVALAIQNKKDEIQKEAPKVLTARKSFAELITTEYPENRFALDPFFEQGSLNMISAPPNTWKSWMLFVMAADIAKGKEFLGTFKTEKTGVMIVNEEDTERLIADRFKTLGITDQSLQMYFRTAQGSKLEVDFCKALLNECKELGVTVVMFDSLRAMTDADENSSTAMQPILDNMKMLTREGITVIFTHHHKKKNQFDRGDSSESSRGSSAINAAISGHLSFEEKTVEGNKFLIIRHLKSKVTHKREPVEVRIINENNTVTFQYLGEHEEAPGMAEKTKNELYEYIKQNEGRWVGMKEMLDKKVGSNENYVRVALSGMTITGLVQMAMKGDLEEQFPELKLVGNKISKFYKYVPVIKKDDDEEDDSF